MNEGIQFDDGESYRGEKYKLSFRDIVLLHLKEIGKYASAEMRGGYWEEKPHPNIQCNMTIKTYIPDAREIYSNAVEYLTDLLFPYFDKKMKEELSELENEKKELYEYYTFEDGKARTFKRTEKKTQLDNRTDFRVERLNLNKRLFRSLCCFLFRKKYLELKQLEE